MRRFVIYSLLVFAVISCYQYMEYRKEILPTPTPIYVPVIEPNPLEDQAIYTKREKIQTAISAGQQSVSQAIVNTLKDYLKGKGIKAARISRKTISQVLGTISAKSFISRNPDKVSLGESFYYRLPKVIFVKVSVDDYYVMCERAYGLDTLKKVLSFKWLKPYEANVFDCSEMSAFLEYWLERNGFNADIVLDSRHSWLLVETEPGNWVDVEATVPDILPVREYKKRFRDIYEAVFYLKDDYNWWNEIRAGEDVIGR